MISPFVGYASLSIFFITYYKYKNPSIKDFSLISFFAFLIFVSSLGYVSLAFTSYVIIVFLIVRNRQLQSFSLIAKLLFLSLVPYLLFAGYLISSHSLRDFYWQNMVFNGNYYFKFFGEIPRHLYFWPFYIVWKFLRSYWYLVVNLSSKNILYMTFLLCDLFFLLSLLKEKKYVLFSFALSLLIFSASRMNVELDISNHNNISFYPLSIVFFSLLTRKLFLHITKDYHEFKGDNVAIAGTLVVGIFFFFLVSEALRTCSGVIGVVHQSRIRNKMGVSTIIEKVLKKDEYYWIGPASIREMYFTDRRVATRHLWYTPWVAASPETRQQFFDDLKANKPTVIGIDKGAVIWGHSVTAYGKDLFDYLNNHYVQAEVQEGEKTYKDFYFLKGKTKRSLIGQKFYIIE